MRITTLFGLLAASALLALAAYTGSAQVIDATPCERACEEAKAACVDECGSQDDPMDCESRCEDAAQDCVAQCP